MRTTWPSAASDDVASRPADSVFAVRLGDLRGADARRPERATPVRPPPVRRLRGRGDWLGLAAVLPAAVTRSVADAYREAGLVTDACVPLAARRAVHDGDLCGVLPVAS